MSKLYILKIKDEEFGDFTELYKNAHESVFVEEIIKKLKKDFQGSLIKIIVAYLKSKPIGFVILVDSYSSSLAKKTIYVEEFFIKKNYRKNGFGREIFQYVIDFSKENNYGRIEWAAQNNNDEAIEFYKKYNAENNWIYYKFNLENNL